MESCVGCLQHCFLCSERTLDCPLCNQLHDVHWQQDHAFSFSRIITSNAIQSPTENLRSTHANPELISNRDFSTIPRETRGKPPMGRRREWTVEENCDFEKWISNNPKPTKQQKHEFANSHSLLTPEQVQNKINNWRNGRNLHRKQTAFMDPLPDWSADVLQMFDESITAKDPALENLSLAPDKQGQPEFLTLVEGDVAFENLEPTIIDSRQPEKRCQSPASSIMRYINSSELEADRGDIEMAVQTASLERLSFDGRNSMCMRLPSLSHQALLEEPPRKENSRQIFVAKIPQQTRPRAICERCKEWGMKCDEKLPCSQCNEAGAFCSNCLQLTPGLVDSPASPDRYRNSRSLEYEESSIHGPQKAMSTTRAPSMASTGTSYSAVSTQSARYSVKLSRRLSANNRRHSRSEGPTPHEMAGSRRPVVQPDRVKVRMPPRRSTLQRQDHGRAEYFRCPIVDCKEVFNSRIDLEDHEISLHFQNYCTFCNRSCRTSQVWREHEQTHIRDKIHSNRTEDILWSCGICSMFGLSETRRYLHIRHHWRHGLTMDDWTGAPRMKLFSPKEIGILQNLSYDEFQNAAEPLLCSSGLHLRSAANVISKALRMERFPARPAVKNLDRTETNPEENAISSNPVSTGVEPSRSTVHGLFAFIRKKLPRLNMKPP